MVNLQDYIRTSKQFRTLEGEDLLMVDYKCLIGDEVSEIWSHTNYFAYVVGGKKKWKTQDQEVLLSSHEALFVRKGANTVYQYFEEPFYVLFIFIPDVFIKKILQKYPDISAGNHHNRTKVESLYPIDLQPEFQTFFESMFAYFKSDHGLHKHLLRLKMEEFVLRILLQENNEALKQFFSRMASKSQVDLEEIMLANYTKPLSIEEYARLCARSLSTFRRDFKELFGLPPSRWLFKKRIKYARFLLETSSQTLEEITYASGFKDRTHFIKLFKQNFDLPPHQYRLSVQKFTD